MRRWWRRMPNRVRPDALRHAQPPQFRARQLPASQWHRQRLRAGQAMSGQCPGQFAPLSGLQFVNGESNACITVALTADQALFSAAYSGPLNPLSLCDHYLADLGAAVSEGVMGSYAFRVNAYDRFVVLVEETVSARESTSLERHGRHVAGPAPSHSGRGTNQGSLDWTTAAVAYQLERT